MKIERQLQGTLNTVFTELIKEKGLDNELHPYTTIEENRADITLKNKSGKTIFFIELKDPTARDGRSVFDGNIIMREAGRAQKGGIKYFGNCNFLACGFFDVERFYDKVSVHEGFFSVQDIARLSSNYTPGKDTIQKLRKIAEFYLERAREIIEKKPVRFSAVDELFVFKIRKLIEVYAPSISTRIWEKYQSDKSFEKEIAAYAKSQLWNRPTTFEEIEKLTHISLLMLISKLIFYKAYVDNQVWHRLHPMKVPDHVCTAAELEAIIWEYFDSFMQITGDFELLIGERSDIIFQMPFLSEDVIHLITDVLNTEGHYNFSKIPYDIIGRIFEELIREDERHKLGQYFTSPIVIDLINAFAIHKSTDIIFDPSCGSGTFLVRAYERKKGLGKLEGVTIQHEELLEQIYGNDLSGYPSYLSMLNLAIRNTREASYPKIINKDFFAITSDTKISLHDQEGTLQKEKLPLFDAIIGNPPYTRQEDIGTMNGTQNKNQIQKLVKKECYFEPSQRTSIYAYFFYHAGVFLKDGGFIAFIVQNSWLETDYGEDLQQYLLSRYKIVSIIDTAVERFFPSASVNTCIIILQKEKDENKRSNNIVKFVYLTKFLKDIVGNSFTPEDLRAWILNTNESIAAEYCNLACVQQDLLTVEKKWGKFLKTPTVYYEIVTKAKGKIKPLGEAAQIRFGIKTGCNEFFIVKDITEQATEKHLFAAVNNSDDFMKLSRVKKQGLRIIENGFDEIWLIEKDLLEPILTSPKDVRKYEFDAEELPYSVVIISDVKAVLKKQFPFAFKYIQWGEKQNFSSQSYIKLKEFMVLAFSKGRSSIKFQLYY